MPEGHTIHRIARDHNKQFAGQKLTVLSPQGRFAESAERLSGAKLNAVEAHGKHLCYRWSGGRLLHIHLGLYGKFRLHNSPPPEPRGQVRVRVIGGSKSFDLNGPNTCELITPTEWLEIQARLGEDPLRTDSDPERAWGKICRSRSPIGTLLLNQSVIAGVGNIYRAEVLFLLGVHPSRPGSKLSREQFDQLWEHLTELMQVGVKYNRIITATPEQVGKTRGRMLRGERLLVYKKHNCGNCGAKIKVWELGARKVFVCAKCQTK